MRGFVPFDSLCSLRVRMTPSYFSSLTLACLSLQIISLGRFPAGSLVNLLLRCSEVFDDDAADAMAGHPGDREAAAFVLNALAHGGDVAELREEKAGESLDAGFARKGPVQLVAEVTKSGAAIERHGTRGAEERRPADVELVFELADDLLEDVFGGDEADGGTELVDDDGDVAAALLKLLKKLNGKLGLGDDGDLAHDFAQGEA